MKATTLPKLIDEAAEGIFDIQNVDGPLTLNELKIRLCEMSLKQLEIVGETLSSAESMEIVDLHETLNK